MVDIQATYWLTVSSGTASDPLPLDQGRSPCRAEGGPPAWQCLPSPRQGVDAEVSMFGYAGIGPPDWSFRPASVKTARSRGP